MLGPNLDPITETVGKMAAAIDRLAAAIEESNRITEEKP